MIHDLLHQFEDLTGQVAQELVSCRPERLGPLLCQQINVLDQLRGQRGLDRPRLERAYRRNRSLLQMLEPYRDKPIGYNP